MIVHFLNDATVITEERFVIFILNKRFSKAYMLSKRTYFIPYLTSGTFF
jgi:hypothetical protein